MRALRVALIVLIAACRDAPPPRATLAEYLGALAGADEAAREREVAGWQLDRAEQVVRAQ